MMTSNRNEIKNMVRDFYHAHIEVGIDGDDLEFFFLANNNLFAFDCEEFDLWNNPWQNICNRAIDELNKLEKDNVIERVLFLIFQPTGYELKLTDLDYFRILCKSPVKTTWGLCSWYEDSTRLIILLKTKGKVCIDIKW